ncbi:MAG TPA: GcrA family cell cycle regulator [Rhizomicrobium sp.]|nr:GcrA family cell cycle regulator [Rhizomicrobium sp.]
MNALVLPDLFEALETKAPAIAGKWNEAVFEVLEREYLECPSNGCHWPSGHPDTVLFRLCKKPRQAGSPYCEKHHLMAHVKLKKRGNSE